MSFQEHRESFWLGAKDMLPLLSGVLPFGLITGANGIALGLSPEQVFGMTMLFFAGSAQLAAYQLIQDNAAFVVVVLTTVVINLRFAIYSATMASTLHPLKKRYRWPLAYMLTDQSYGLCSSPERQSAGLLERVWYYFGGAIVMCSFWVMAVLLGVAVGASIPSEWSLEFSIPLAFLAMLVGTVRNRTLLLVAVASGAFAVLLRSLPLNMGFIAAVMIGVGVGLVASKLRRRGADLYE